MKRIDWILMAAVIAVGVFCFTALNTFEPGAIWG